jgi:hypothetical protein
VILILEDDADREQYQRVHPLNPEFLNPDTMRPATVWISPEAYAKDVVLADFRARVQTMAGPGLGYYISRDAVLALIGGSGE